MASLHQSQEKGHMHPHVMETWLRVSDLPNICLQPCPCSCAPVHTLHSASASRVIIHLLLLISSSMVLCIVENSDLVQHVISWVYNPFIFKKAVLQLQSGYQVLVA